MPTGQQATTDSQVNVVGSSDEFHARAWKVLGWCLSTAILGLVGWCVWISDQHSSGRDFDRDLLAANTRNREVIDELRVEVRRLADRRDPAIELLLARVGELNTYLRDAIERSDRTHSIHDERIRALERSLPR